MQYEDALNELGVRFLFLKVLLVYFCSKKKKKNYIYKNIFKEPDIRP